MLGLEKNNSYTIDFVFTCFIMGIISNTEVEAWAEKVISENEVKDLPDYIFDLINFKGNPLDLYRLVGFNIGGDSTKSERMAFYGIRVKRGKGLPKDDVSFNEEQALQALEKHSEIEKLFRETFPFIDF